MGDEPLLYGGMMRAIATGTAVPKHIDNIQPCGISSSSRMMEMEMYTILTWMGTRGIIRNTSCIIMVT